MRYGREGKKTACAERSNTCGCGPLQEWQDHDTSRFGRTINRTFPNLYEYPYEHMGRVLHVAFDKCKTEDEKAAVASVFTDKDGNPLVKE